MENNNNENRDDNNLFGFVHKMNTVEILSAIIIIMIILKAIS
jgi:hypothetical protein